MHARADGKQERNVYDYDSAVLGAAAAFAAGRVAFASSDLDAAAAKLRESHRLWLTVDAPYEGARARLELGRTLAAKRNNEAAFLELRAASAVFERLGARKDFDAATVATEAITT